jgi:ABC-type cobalamin/Fe3+-siderophores transport system ATPase subunit
MLPCRKYEQLLESLLSNSLFITDNEQLVVVGDQSSGKSSVLQGITRLPFPVDDKLCTRFPTEVSLRRSSGVETISAEIRIAVIDAVENGSSDSQEQEPIDTRPEDDNDTEDSVVEEAIHQLQCTNHPFGSREFAVEFKRMLREVRM